MLPHPAKVSFLRQKFILLQTQKFKIRITVRIRHWQDSSPSGGSPPSSGHSWVLLHVASPTSVSSTTLCLSLSQRTLAHRDTPMIPLRTYQDNFSPHKLLFHVRCIYRFSFLMSFKGHYPSHYVLSYIDLKVWILKSFRLF